MIHGPQRVGRTAQPLSRTTRGNPKAWGRVGRDLSIAALAALLLGVVSPPPVHARSVRQASGYSGRHVHAAWAGPDVGLIAWTTATDFVSTTACGSSWAAVDVDPAWNSAALHNGAELDIMFAVVRTDGRHVEVGPVFKITDARPWPGHPAFGGQFRARVSTPHGLYLKSATATSWIVNGGVAYPPLATDTVRLQQWTKSC